MKNIQHIKDQYKRMAKNFMTPNVRETEITSDGRLLELSDGYDMDGKNIYGVTEFETIDGKLQTTRRGQMHRTIQSARKHFNNLK